MNAISPDVLLVEDDAAIREALAEVLDEEGYQVLTANHGAAALDHLSAGCAPQVILLDLMMPVMDGWQFLSRLQAMPAWAPIPVIILSAVTDALPQGAHAALAKPLDLDALLGALSGCVRPSLPCAAGVPDVALPAAAHP